MTEHTTMTNRHTTFYLVAGPRDGPLIIFVHRWPELSIGWRGIRAASRLLLAALGGVRGLMEKRKSVKIRSVEPQLTPAGSL
jgi:hypothetical protein